MIRIAHLGAGHHGLDKTSKYEQLLYRSLRKKTPLETCGVIEANHLTNTGKGSNLNIDGKVKCDGCFISLENNIIKTGSMFNVSNKHPVNCVIQVYRQLDNWLSAVNKPYILDYDNLHHLAISLEHDDDDLLITKSTRHIYTKYKDQVKNNIIDSLSDTTGVTDVSEVCDTIGVTNIDVEHKTVDIMCSSGGNFFKLPNRIGCAALIGSGCDLILRNDNDTYISIMCTGNGEQICQLKLASYIINNITVDDETSYASQVETLIHQLEILYNIQSYFGLVLCVTEKLYTTIVYLHTTETFYWGFKYKDKIDVILSRSKVKGKMTYGEFFLRH